MCLSPIDHSFVQNITTKVVAKINLAEIIHRVDSIDNW